MCAIFILDMNARSHRLMTQSLRRFLDGPPAFGTGCCARDLANEDHHMFEPHEDEGVLLYETVVDLNQPLLGSAAQNTESSLKPKS